MKLVIARHGDTFEPGDKVVWVGSKNDLPLAKNGTVQASAVAAELRKRDLLPKTIITAPLLRTKQFGEVIAAHCAAPLQTEPCLTEIDYGAWSGKTNDEIKAEFGESVLHAWQNRSEWPPSQCEWKSSEAQVIAELKAFSSELLKKFSSTDTVMLVTSNGKLRYFLTLIPEAFELYRNKGELTVRTGAFCVFEHEAGKWSVSLWNYRPQ